MLLSKDAASAVAHDWWTPEGYQRILSGDLHVREIEAATSFIQR
jgi:hypothetical protein